MKIYHYTTCDSFYRIWLSREFRLCQCANMNDLYERQKICVMGITPEHGISKSVIQNIGDPMDFIFKQISKFRQVSFCKDYQNEIEGCMSSMMWGQYAKNDKGVCIELDKEKLLSNNRDILYDNVDYKDIVPYIEIQPNIFSVNVEENLRSFIINNKEKIFFTKHTHWEHENEFRIVSDKKDNVISIKDAVNCIYVQDSNKEIKLIKALIGSEVPIKYICMEADTNAKCYYLSIKDESS